MSRPLPDPAVQRLCRSIADEPHRRRQVAIVAPGGHGKTAALAELTAAYRAAGVPVVDAGVLDGPFLAPAPARTPLAVPPDPRWAAAVPHETVLVPPTCHVSSDSVRPDLPAAPTALGASAGTGVVPAMPVGSAGTGVVLAGAGVREAGAWVVVVDDAQRLDEERVDRLRAVAGAGRCTVLVACRPWPMGAALSAFVAGCERVVLSPLDRARAALVMAAVRADRPSRELVDFVLAQTGGVPRLVRRLAAVADRELPDPVLLAFRDELQQLDDTVSTYLLALDAGASAALVERLLAERRLPGDTADVVAAAHATGLVGTDGAPLPVVRRALAALVPAERRVAVRQRLARLQFEAGGSVLGAAVGLLDTGSTDPGMAVVFRAAAAEAAADRPALAVRCYLAAVSAGTAMDELAVPLADAAARAGRLDLALRLADRVITRDPATDAAPALEIAAAALAHRGEWATCAALYQRAGTPTGRSFAALARVGTGRPPAPADDGPDQAGPAAWGMAAGAAALMADGVAMAVHGHGADALSTLVRATTLLEPAGATVLLPDSPAALAAIVALHRGEPAIAESVLHRAATAALGGPLLAPRHLLLRAWTHLLCGRTDDAATLLRRLDGRRSEPRDALFAAGLRVGLARRAGDLPALEAAWSACGEAVLCHPVDLFTLLPLGEFAVAAARLGDRARVAPRMAAARSLLAGLGDPPLWAASLHWDGMHAAVLAEDPAAAAEHVAALAVAAEADRHARVLHAAARCWLGVLGGAVDADLVEAATGGLHAAGLSWDAARLAGQAAIRTDDRKDMVRLLDLARRFRPRSSTHAAPPPMSTVADPVGPPGTTGVLGVVGAPGTPSVPGVVDPVVESGVLGVVPPAVLGAVGVAGAMSVPAVAAVASAVPTGPLPDGAAGAPVAGSAATAAAGPADVAEVAGPLSAREWEVAELVAGGLTYKEVGGRLFISAKTVEHHVARMRRKLGCDSRGQLMARLRDLAASRP